MSHLGSSELGGTSGRGPYKFRLSRSHILMQISRLFAATAATATLALLASPGLAAEAVPTSQAPTAVTAQAAAAGTSVRFATFNVRTSSADIGTSRQWLRRALSVAQEIKEPQPRDRRHPGARPGPRRRQDGLRRQRGFGRPPACEGAGQHRRQQVQPHPDHGVREARRLPRHPGHADPLRQHQVPPGHQVRRDHRQVELEPFLRHGHADHKGARVPPCSAAYAEFEDRSTGRNFFVISGPPRLTAQQQPELRKSPTTPCAPLRSAPSTPR